jgi:hypothetical protein
MTFPFGAPPRNVRVSLSTATSGSDYNLAITTPFNGDMSAEDCTQWAAQTVRTEAGNSPAKTLSVDLTSFSPFQDTSIGFILTPKNGASCAASLQAQIALEWSLPVDFNCTGAVKRTCIAPPPTTRASMTGVGATTGTTGSTTGTTGQPTGSTTGSTSEQTTGLTTGVGSSAPPKTVSSSTAAAPAVIVLLIALIALDWMC